MSDIIKRDGAMNPALRWQQRQIDRSVSLEAYRHARKAELVDFKRASTDWAYAGRIASDLQIAEEAVRAIQRCPEVAALIADTLSDRGRTLSELFRELR